MYINPFVAGVLSVIFAEIVAIFITAILIWRKK